MSARQWSKTLPLRLSEKGLLLAIVLLLTGVALLTVSALIRVPMWPVPMTLQTWAVLLIGAGYRSPLGALTVVAYITLAALGAPILAGSSALTIGGPTFGYLMGFAVAAAVMGWLARRGWASRGWASLITLLLIGQILIYLAGLAWLQLAWLHDLRATLSAGLFPFLVGDMTKLLLAAVLLRSTQAFRRIERKAK